MYKAEYNSLFDQGVTLYLVLNTDALDSSYTRQELAMENSRQEGALFPAPSSAAAVLPEGGREVFQRKKKRDKNNIPN